MMNLIAVGLVVGIVGIAVSYIVKEKKKRVKCIGCPAGGTCTKCGTQKCE